MNVISFRDYKTRHKGTRSHAEAVSEVQREIEVRRRLYDRWVAEGKLSWVDADDRLSRLQSALQYLHGISSDDADHTHSAMLALARQYAPHVNTPAAPAEIATAQFDSAESGEVRAA
jgi:hypothetical protein